MTYVLNGKSVTFSKTEKTIVFVDYEAWYWGLNNEYALKPDVREWFDDLQDKGQIDEVVFFGDFSHEKMQPEVLKIRSITSSIVDCSKNANMKDYTDFIMLDQIYQRLIRQSDVKQFVLFTGDGHFQSAVAFLRNFNNKTVGVYALNGTLSSQLKESVNWYVEIGSEDNKTRLIEDLIINSLRQVESTNRDIPTFGRTVKAISAYNSGVSEEDVRIVLTGMIKNGWIRQDKILHPESSFPITIIVPDWEAIDSLS